MSFWVPCSIMFRTILSVLSCTAAFMSFLTVLVKFTAISLVRKIYVIIALVSVQYVPKIEVFCSSCACFPLQLLWALIILSLVGFSLAGIDYFSQFPKPTFYRFLHAFFPSPQFDPAIISLFHHIPYGCYIDLVQSIPVFYGVNHPWYLEM